MLMRIVYPDGSWFIGDRNSRAIGFPLSHETKGTHHFYVVDVGTEAQHLTLGQEAAVPVNQAKFFVLNYGVRKT